MREYEEDEAQPEVSLMEMGPGAPMPVSFMEEAHASEHASEHARAPAQKVSFVYVDPKVANSGSPAGVSFLETGPGAPVPVNFFLVNSSMTSGDQEKDPKDSPAATNRTLADKQPASPDRPPVLVSMPVADEDIPRPLQRQVEHVTQKLEEARARFPTPTSHQIFLTVLGIGSVVFIVILLAVMRCVYDAMYSAYEGARERSRPPSLLSSLTPGPMEKGLETLLRIPETAREDTVAKKEAALAETGSTCSEAERVD